MFKLRMKGLPSQLRLILLAIVGLLLLTLTVLAVSPTGAPSAGNYDSENAADIWAEVRTGAEDINSIQVERTLTSSELADQTAFVISTPEWSYFSGTDKN